MEGIERVVLITGASVGIGAATARRLAGPTTALALHALGAGRDGEALETIAAELSATGAPVLVLHGDLAERGTAEALVRDTLARFGRIDQIVSNAGFANRSPFGEADAAVLEKAHRIMVEAFFSLVTAALPSLQTSAWGRVVAVSSFAARLFRPDGLYPVTGSAKAALEALAKALAIQLAPKGIPVNVVAPGYTRKDAAGHSAISADAWKHAAAITPMGRLAEPDDIAAAIVFLLSREARHITGQVLAVDGGLTLT